MYQVIQNNWNQAGWYFHKIKDISIKLKYMLSGNVFQFYDQIGSNMEEQGETTDGKRVQKHWRERESTVSNMQCKPGRDRLEHRMTEGPTWSYQTLSKPHRKKKLNNPSIFCTINPKTWGHLTKKAKND